MFDFCKTLSEDDLNKAAEKGKSLIDSICSEANYTKITDRPIVSSSWPDAQTQLRFLTFSDENDFIDMSDDLLKALNSIFYGNVMKDGDNFKVRNLYAWIATAPTMLADYKPVPNSPSTPDKITEPLIINYDNEGDVIVDNAAGAAHSLREFPFATQLFGDIVRGREDIDVEEILAALVQIKQGLQGANPKTPLGKIYQIDGVQYQNWLHRSKEKFSVVGPYLLMKIAQQARCLLKMEGDHITLRNGTATIIVKNSFEFEGDGEQFSQGLTFDKKPVKYSYISPMAYILVELFHRYYQVRVGEGGLLVAKPYSPKDATKALLDRTPPLLRDTGSPGQRVPCIIRTVSDKIAADFTALKTKNKPVDVILDKLARIAQPYLEEAKMATWTIQAIPFQRAGFTMYDSLKQACDKATNQREAFETIGLNVPCPGPTAALTLLKAEREHRNITDYMQYAYKNMASLGGNNAIPAVDTVLKGARIADFCKTELRLSPDMPITMCGVAYGHMVDPLKRTQMTLFDKSPAKNSPHRVNIGNIYAIASDWVTKDPHILIDDSATHDLVTEKEQLKCKREKVDIVHGQTGDWNKFLKLILLPPTVTIVSKMSLANIVAAKDPIKKLLFPNGVPKYRHIGIYKFGKIHNPEVFLVLSNSPAAKATTQADFEAHILSTSYAIFMANTILSKCALAGTPTGILSRNELNVGWHKVLSVLPVRWPWYLRVYKASVTAGSMVASSVSSYDLDFLDQLTGEREAYDLGDILENANSLHNPEASE